ncbi:MAG TPA: RDD family protein [Campylobacterales bacterium]|nr:RDD family protein [Campylobacterales bacterium]
MSESFMQEFHIAPTGKRLGAFFIDDIIISVFVLIIYYAQLEPIFNEVQASGDWTPFFGFLSSVTLTFIVLKMIYQTFFVWQNGMTPGKMMMGIRVVEMETGRNPRFEVAFLRASFRIVSDMVFYVGYIIAFFNPLVQTLHDKIAKTLVVNA